MVKCRVTTNQWSPLVDLTPETSGNDGGVTLVNTSGNDPLLSCQHYTTLHKYDTNTLTTDTVPGPPEPAQLQLNHIYTFSSHFLTIAVKYSGCKQHQNKLRT